ncbi:MAG: pyridoxamine 5'-phosphate oxidase [bacterium]
MSGAPVLDRDPFRVFQTWLDEAARAGLEMPEAATLATATPDGKPSARLILHKGVRDGGFLFVTNYASRKAAELDANPHAALVFHWARLERQVRIEGRAARAPRAVSHEYFATRPRESQIGAWASPQSARIDDRESLDRRVGELEREYAGRDIPCPDFWGGYILTPESFEFWIGQRGRLHDRFLYERDGAAWKMSRLAP